jgi:hypothetical protein
VFAHKQRRFIATKWRLNLNAHSPDSFQTKSISAAPSTQSHCPIVCYDNVCNPEQERRKTRGTDRWTHFKMVLPPLNWQTVHGVSHCLNIVKKEYMKSFLMSLTLFLITASTRVRIYGCYSLMLHTRYRMITELKSDTLNTRFCETQNALVCRSKWMLYHRKTEGCSLTDKYMDVLSQTHRGCSVADKYMDVITNTQRMFFCRQIA